MPEFKAPLRDMRFVFEELLNSYEHYQNFEKGEEATPDTVNAILEECAKFSEQELAPLYQTGDEEGCTLKDGEVQTPKGFKEAYQTYVESGWQGINHAPEYGGLGLPISLGVLKSELISMANWSWGMYPGLSIGAMNTIFLHGDEDQKQT